MYIPNMDPFQEAFDSAPIGIGMLDLDGLFVHVNSALCDLLGYTEDELLHTTFMTVTHPDDLYRDIVYMDQVLAGRITHYEMEKRFFHKTGRICWVSLDVSYVKAYGDGAPRFMVYVKEITARKQSEQALKESVQRYRSLFDFDPDMIYSLTAEGRMVCLNQACERITGYTASELTRIDMLLFPDDLDRIERTFDKAAKGFPQSYDLHFRHKRGHTVELQVIHVPWINQGGTAGVFGVAKDMTELRKQSRALEESESRYRLLAEHSIDMIIRYSADFTILYVSPAVKSLTGFEPEELSGLSGLDFVHPEDLEELYQKHNNVEPLQTDSRNIFRLLKKDGDYVWIEAANRIVRDPVSGKFIETVSVFRDITEQRQQEEKLRVSEELYKLISENAQDTISYISPDGICRYVSPPIRELLGYDPEEMIGRNCKAYFHPDDLELLESAALTHFSEVELITHRLRHKNGNYIWLESVLKIIRDQQGIVEKIISVSRDISERKLAEEELRRQEERYRELVEHSPDGVIISSKGNLLYVNNTAVQLLGGTSKEEVLQHSNVFIHLGSVKSAQIGLEQVEQGHASELVEQKLIRLDGRIIDVEVKSLPTIYQQESAVHTIIRDISERKKTQELLKSSEKLNIAGQLAAGIAHEIRNPLTSLKGFLKLIQSGSGGKKEHFDIMHDEMDRIEMIVSELLVLAKPDQGTAFREIDLTILLKQVVTLLESQAIMSNVQIEAVYQAEPLKVIGDENQLKQVYINIIKNGIEAMLDGGVISIEAYQQNSQTKVRIIDQGDGIPAESIPRLGEPFYTTKQNGNGLGLMVSYKIIEHHGGQIHIQSEQGKGTTFEINIPAAP
jgi:two-component system sporulation sensor kinase A